LARASQVHASSPAATRRSSRASAPAQRVPAALTLHNEDIAAAFDEMADLLAIEGENPFRIRAYRRAAQTIRGLSRELASMHGTEEFEALPGIGADLAGKIGELLHTGKCHALEQHRRRTPPAVRELLALPGLGPGACALYSLPAGCAASMISPARSPPTGSADSRASAPGFARA